MFVKNIFIFNTKPTLKQPKMLLKYLWHKRINVSSCSNTGTLFLASKQDNVEVSKWIIWQSWCCSRKDVDNLWLSAAWKTSTREARRVGPQFQESPIYHTWTFSQSLSSGWAMEVQLISDCDVHTLGTKGGLVSEEKSWKNIFQQKIFINPEGHTTDFSRFTHWCGTQER